MRLNGKIALITGASRGIGAAVAKRFAKEGAHVILAARTVGGLEEVDDEIKKNGGTSTLVPINLLEFDKIDQLGGIIAEKFGRLDILVGNAAMLGVLSPMRHITPEIWDKTMALNATANYRLIRSFDPLLRQSKNGRLIFVTSGAANDDTPFWGAYATSKAALEKIAKIYAKEIEKTNILVNLIDPGAVGTNMMAEVAPGQNLANFKKPAEITDKFVELAENNLTESGKIFGA